MKYIVDFHNDAPDSDISQYLATNGCTVLKEWNNFDKVYLVEAAAEPPAASIVAHIVDDSNTVAIKPMDITIDKYSRIFNHDLESTEFSTSDEKDWWKNYCLPKPVFDEPTTKLSRKGSHVSVYIMDSGIKADHPEFVDANITNVYSVTPGDFSDNSGHGTALSSLVVGKTCGVTSAKLKVVKIFDPQHETLQSEFLDALDAILEDHVDGTFSVLNCSWSIPRNQWVEYKLKECMDEGVWVMAAAGNSGHAIEDVTPAAMPEAFTIGAYSPDLVPCDFSDYTGETAISNTNGPVNGGILNGWAPGQQIYVAGAKSQPYGFTAGTSTATAIASAVVAYNLNDHCFPDGKMFPNLAGLIIAGPDANATAFIVGRPDLLDLSDPKYANSTNLIVTFNDLHENYTHPCTNESSSSVRVGKPQNGERLFDPHKTKSVTPLSGWPSFAQIFPDGQVWLNPSEQDGPTGSDSYKLYETTVQRVSDNDEVETISYNIYVLASNFEPTDLPEDHPIQITLLSSCTNLPNVSCIISSTPACFSSCPGGGCCDPKGLQCVCANSFGFDDETEWNG